MIYLQTSAPCPVCGTQHTTCGQGADVTPLDIPTMENRMPPELRLYSVVVNGYPTRMRLNADDAKRLGGSPVDGDTGTLEQTEQTEPDQTEQKARAQVPNKARTAGDTK